LGRRVAGLKYNWWKDVCCQKILSIGLTYEMPVGSTRSLQGNGDGEFNLFAAYGALFGDCNHFLTTAGFRLPTDRSAENQVFYWSGHVDRQLSGSCFYGFLEGNWFHWMSNGTVAAFDGIQGGDFFNLGSTGVAGTDIVTGAFGVKYKPSLLNEIGLAYELPLTNTRAPTDDGLHPAVLIANDHAGTQSVLLSLPGVPGRESLVRKAITLASE
jgi:hypothetical protein